MIEALDLTKYYGNVAAIQNVSFSVAPGEILGFLGPNAAGKTTTMRILAGFIPPSTGAAKVCGYDVLKDSLEARRHVGYLPETVPLYSEMSISAYLRFCAKLRSVKQINTRLEYVLNACHLEERAHQVIGTLSRGYRQRVGIAQALIHNPDVLILDEPTVGLDPRQIADVRSLISSLAGNHTVILSTHILSEVSQVCSRVLIINEGRIIAEDSPDHLAARIHGGQRINVRIRSDKDISPQLGDISGVTSVTKNNDGLYLVECEPGQECRPVIAQTLVNAGHELLELHAQDVSLEEVFLRLTSDNDSGEAKEVKN